MPRVVSLVILSLLAACGASFEDERDERLGTPVDALIDPAATVVAHGTFVGRAGHAGRGGVDLVRSTSGRFALRFDSAFSVSDTPGPFVVLTSRAEIGTRIDPATDREIGALIESAGEQTYAIDDDGGSRQVFIFCKPFGVEIAKATLQ